jgi:transcriptional regulator with XRE-family HTH domain
MEDPELRQVFERKTAEVTAIDAVVNALDELREEQRMSKAELAREIGKNPATIRRLLTLDGANPELRTVVAMANALDADIQNRPSRPGQGPRQGTQQAARWRSRLMRSGRTPEGQRFLNLPAVPVKDAELRSFKSGLDWQLRRDLNLNVIKHVMVGHRHGQMWNHVLMSSSVGRRLGPSRCDRERELP